mmetsp:Transcript_1716/g.3779  ORF Transcript_1716/g.3779 Transcript_1716/m.3779 type:complete len:697 (-) Transcript_1716:67-2157(-)
MTQNGQRNTKDDTLDDDNNNKDLLQQIASSFRSGVEVKDRKYRLMTFKQCFIGSDAVDFMVSNGIASNREEAIKLGQSLMTELSLFEHVTRDHPFADDHLFYHFIDRGDVSINPVTKEKFQWSDYLDPSSSTSYSSGGMSLQPTLPVPNMEYVSPNDVHVASHIWPLDDHNLQLLDHVHPTGWKDPTSQNKYDLVVIGGGPAGLVTAAGAAGVGARVALIEANFLGGDCLNMGCVPSKSLIHAAKLAHTVKRNQAALADAGITIQGGADSVSIDFAKIMERIRRIRAGISHHDSAERFTKELGVEVFMGRGTFVDNSSVMVNGQTLKFNKAVIATGGYPSLLPMPGLKELHQMNTNPGNKPRPYVMTNETFFNMTEQPQHLVVCGPGVIGVEMAQSMQRLGTKVTVLGRSGRILPKEDDDHAKTIQDQLEQDGVEFRLSVTEYVGVVLTGNILDNGHPEMSFKIQEQTDGKKVYTELLVDAVLVATGRRPNVNGMELEKAGVEYDGRAGIVVNDKLQTTNQNIYSAGDCCSQYKFTHAADFMARAVVRNALFFGKERMSQMLIPYATFTDPEIASVGLYGKDLDAKVVPFRTFEKHFKDNDRAICDGETEGMVRIRVDAKSDKILGATIIGKNAGNMISEITLAMQSGTGLGTLASVIHPYPTTAEAIRQAGDLFNRTKLTPATKSILRGLIKVQR